MRDHKFNVENVIDVRTKGKLPNRLKVLRVYQLCSGNGVGSDKYRYDVVVESTGKVVSVGETRIQSSLIRTDYGVYLIAPVSRRYEKGYRFVCNVNKAETSINNKIAQVKASPEVYDVMTSEAYGRNGQMLPNRTAIWAKYRHPLTGTKVKTI